MIVKLTAQDREQFKQLLNDFSAKHKETTTTNEVFTLNHELNEAIRSFYKQIERREFSELAGDRDKIMKSAEDQVNLLIVDRCEDCKRWMSHRTDEEYLRANPGTVYGIRIDGDDFYLDIDSMIRECKEDLLVLHYEALSADQDAVDQLDSLVKKIISDNPKTSSDKGKLLHPKRKTRSKKISPIYSEADQDFFMFSTTQAQDVLYQLISNDGDTKQTAQNINKISNRNKAKALKSKDGKAIQVITDNSQTTIEILSSAYRKFNSRPAKKMLLFVENELYQQIYYKGNMNDDLVTFPLQKLVDKGLYTSIANARRGFFSASDILTAYRISATVKSGKTEYTTKEGNARIVVIPSMWVDNNQCNVRLSQEINWKPIMKEYFLMPDSWWALPDNASDLELEIFRSIRLSKDKIQNGSLTIKTSLKTVSAWLNLPTETKNPKRDVKDPIEIAVKQINESLDKKHFKSKIIADSKAPLSQYLSGYLETNVSGKYIQNLFVLNEHQQARIENAMKKKDEIVKEASIRKLTQQMIDDGKSAT